MHTDVGRLVISLDFELFWGMSDKLTLEEYGERILGERTAIPRMLGLFADYGLHATWATVGMLALDTREELLSALPDASRRPDYEDSRISNYGYLSRAPIGKGEADDRYHFGGSLIRLIQSYPHQEVASHTFSHYYCLEKGQNVDSFAADLQAQKRTLARFGVTPSSLVFPRNQENVEYVRAAANAGITAYRGNERHFLYRARREAEQTFLIRLMRLLNHYVPITGHHTYTIAQVAAGGAPYNVAASRFLRPYAPRLRAIEPLRRARIKDSMTHAAKRGEIFHIWWHPHNVSVDQEENFAMLENIARHFVVLKQRYGMESANIGEIAQLCERSTL